jgi:dUTP pyrophosphatase
MLKLSFEGSNAPFYATTFSAGFDFCSTEDICIESGQWKTIGTGVRILESQTQAILSLVETQLAVIPELQIRPRSGLATKFGITILNTPSTVDCDYRGEIKINLINHGTDAFVIKKGERIAQGVCTLVFQCPGLEVKEKIRAEGGFGSTGV